jgi:hypothetical protein
MKSATGLLQESSGPSRNWDAYFQQRGVGKDGKQQDEASLEMANETQASLPNKKKQGLGTLQARGPSQNWDEMLGKNSNIDSATGEERAQHHWNSWYNNQEQTRTKVPPLSRSHVEHDEPTEFFSMASALAIVSFVLFYFFQQ